MNTIASCNLMNTTTIIKMATAKVDGSNAPTWKQAMDMAGQFGRHAAAGTDSRPNMGRTATALAEAGTIDLSKVDAEGNRDDKSERDAASWMYARFFAENKSAVYSADKDDPKSVAVQASKLRAFVKVGLLKDVSGGDVLDRAAAMIAADPRSCKPAYDALIDVARAQIKGDQAKVALSDDQIRDIIAKPAKVARNIKERITAVMGTTSNIWEDAQGETKDALEEAVNALRKALELAVKSGQ
jgi:hypothetical protein